MRFHCGISFSWRTIKKFLIPILIGFLAYFGFNFIYDNNSIPLGFLKVNALENYNTTLELDYSNVSDIVALDIDNSHHKLIDLVNAINSNNINYDYFIYVSNSSTGGFNKLFIYIFDTSSTYTFNLWGYNSWVRSIMTTSNNKWGYNLSMSTLPDDIFTTSFYTNSITCLTTGSCSYDNSFTSIRPMFFSNYNITNNSNGSAYYPLNLDLNFIFYSSKDLILDNSYQTDSNTIYYKNLSINNELIEVGDKFPTYYDFYLSPEPEPDPEPIPDPEPVPDENIVHKALFNKIYWFDDNTSEIGILSSIYILLFLYCLTMVIFKFLAYLHNMKKRW